MKLLKNVPRWRDRLKMVNIKSSPAEPPIFPTSLPPPERRHKNWRDKIFPLVDIPVILGPCFFSY